MDPSLDYYEHLPAQIPRASEGRKVYSDYFMASKNRYKARISKFVRNVQTGGEVATTAIATGSGSDMHDDSKIETFQKKSRFSFKHDGVVAVSQLIDIFCQGLFHEAMRQAEKRKEQEVKEEVAEPCALTPQDIQDALKCLGWGKVSCIDT
ncbi:Uncharacterized protein SCF082_LOCUS37409 [Durusdinium trenchii]|uniref:Histone H2B n=1 Tax=Durusdinium trenchii TaxID=1381693 RepID=A0ABP0PT45_9DINO